MRTSGFAGDERCSASMGRDARLALAHVELRDHPFALLRLSHHVLGHGVLVAADLQLLLHLEHQPLRELFRTHLVEG